ncbi:MAG TPA: hypothetical protein VGF06_13455 [Terriglobales bacterium]
METVFAILSRVLTVLFVIGMAGCVIVIPMVAYMLFQTLFEPDTPDEIRRNLARQS